MHTNAFYLIGAGGHGKVVLDALLAAGVHDYKVHIRDGAPELKGKDFLGHIIQCPVLALEMSGHHFHIAVGNCRAREQLFSSLLKMEALPLTIVHPAASLSRFAVIGNGSFLAAQSVVAPAAVVGAGVIVNHGAVVDHDCVVGDFSHIAPNATLGGCVIVGVGALVGAGANILPGVSIGDGAVIGAGAVVTNDVHAGEVRAGVPAKNTRRS
jgi:sugar O-acyltransferase (sialic acid O-acetyltransferase NeuD family)